jgi:SnoaL-like domain
VTVEDELRIRNLIARVAWETDQWKSTESYTANYTEDCIWEIAGQDPTYRGHAGLSLRLREMLEAGICGPGLPTRHCITSLEVIADPVDSDAALARSFAVMVTAENGKSSVSLYGDYEDSVRRSGDRWLISRRLIRIPGSQ